MRAFFARNKQIFVVGVIVAVVFLVIILTALSRPKQEPTLNPISTTGNTNRVSDYNLGTGTGDLPQIETPEVAQPSGSEPTTGSTAKPNTGLTVLEIHYTSNGYSPKNTTAVIGQTVRWINDTEYAMEMKQTKNIYPEFKEAVTIPAHETKEFVLSKIGLWAYQEQETGYYGSIFILPK